MGDNYLYIGYVRDKTENRFYMPYFKMRMYELVINFIKKTFHIQTLSMLF